MKLYTVASRLSRFATDGYHYFLDLQKVSISFFSLLKPADVVEAKLFSNRLLFALQAASF